MLIIWCFAYFTIFARIEPALCHVVKTDCSQAVAGLQLCLIMLANKKRLWAASLCLLLGITSLFALVAPAQTVLAAGEKYSWDSKDVIKASGGQYQGNVTFIKNGSTFVANGDGTVTDKSGCVLVVSVSPSNDNKSATVSTSLDPSLLGSGKTPCSQSVMSKYDKKPSLGNTANASKTDATISTNQATSELGPGGDTEKTCESEGGALAWLGCGLLRLIDGAIYGLDNAISTLLFVESSKFDNPQVEGAWGTLRNIALLIIVPMMLFMVIGTAVGFGPFDAYTVRKALPRMVIAVMFIVLSLEITQFGVQLSNAVGSGISNLIFSAVPADQKIENLTDLFSSKDTYIFTGLTAGVGAIAVGSAALTLGVVFSFALVTLVALLVGFIVLTMRQVIIIMLITLAPLAILSWIFPGNDKPWNIWKTTFIAMLMMYPLIMLLIVSGRFVAGLV